MVDHFRPETKTKTKKVLIFGQKQNETESNQIKQQHMIMKLKSVCSSATLLTFNAK